MRVGPGHDPDKYELLEVISRGGEGTVWKGSLRIDSLTVPVAVKIVNPGHVKDVENWRTRWMRQAELLRSLSHPGLVDVREVFEGPPPHESGEADVSTSTLVLVMNWVEGPTLAEWVERNPDRSPLESIKVIGALASAVDYLHTFGDGTTPILHRDIKPSNVILSPTGPKLVDFGFARPADVDVSMTYVTTPRYTSPEVAAGLGYTAASDRFALGATAYFALTGHNPTLDDPNLMHQRLGEVKGLEHRPDIQELVLSMMRPNPAERPSSTLAWAHSLAVSSLIGTPTQIGRRGQQPTPVATTEPQAARSPRKLALAVITVLVFLVGVGAVAVAMARSPRTIPMPDVMGLPDDQALQVLQGIGFVDVRVQTASSTDDPGTVIGVSPEAGVKIRPDNEVLLLVAESPAELEPGTPETTTSAPLVALASTTTTTLLPVGADTSTTGVDAAPSTSTTATRRVTSTTAPAKPPTTTTTMPASTTTRPVTTTTQATTTTTRVAATTSTTTTIATTTTTQPPTTTSTTTTTTTATTTTTTQPPTTTTTTQPASAPSAPAKPGVSAGNAKVTITWAAPSNGGSTITSYQIQADTGANGSVDGTKTGITSSPYAWGGLTNWTSYKFRVRACNAVGCGSYSSWSSTAVPKAPVSYSVSRGSYVRSCSPGACYNIKVTISGLKPNGWYYYDIKDSYYNTWGGVTPPHVQASSSGSFTNQYYYLFTGGSGVTVQIHVWGDGGIDAYSGQYAWN